MDANVIDVSGFEILQHYLDEKPDLLTSEIENAMDAGGVRWRMPENSDEVDVTKGRWSNLDFLGRGKAHNAWKDYWSPDICRFWWDAIGRVQMGEVGWEWLLLTAFAHPGELEQNLPLDGTDERIVSAIGETKQRYGVDPDIDWINVNSCLATRLFALSFLRKYGVCSRMLFVYFYAGEAGEDDPFPSVGTWNAAIATAEQQLGLTGRSVPERRIYQMFLPAI